MKRKCTYCGGSSELRPYGPNGSDVCFTCATATPEREAQAKQAFIRQISTNEVLVLDPRMESGPVPLLKKDQKRD